MLSTNGLQSVLSTHTRSPNESSKNIWKSHEWGIQQIKTQNRTNITVAFVDSEWNMLKTWSSEWECTGAASSYVFDCCSCAVVSACVGLTQRTYKYQFINYTHVQPMVRLLIHTYYRQIGWLSILITLSTTPRSSRPGLTSINCWGQCSSSA